MKTNLTTLAPDLTASDAAKINAWIWHPTLPVVDRQNRLLGVLRVERLEDFIQETSLTPRESDISETGSALGEVLQIGISATASAFGLDDVHPEKDL